MIIEQLTDIHFAIFHKKNIGKKNYINMKELLKFYFSFYLQIN